jgi:hypothetical protein
VGKSQYLLPLAFFLSLLLFSIGRLLYVFVASPRSHSLTQNHSLAAGGSSRRACLLRGHLVSVRSSGWGVGRDAGGRSEAVLDEKKKK